MGYAIAGTPTYKAYTPTFGGFSVSPTVTARYMAVGKMVTVWVSTTGHGTSNATTFTITLPFSAAATVTQSGVLSTLTNGGSLSSTQGRITTTASSNVANLNINAGTGAWTNTGNKSAGFIFTYERL